MTALAAGDFAGLTALETLLNGCGLNNDLTTLPAGVFAGLTELTDLTLYGNGLTTLPDGVFDKLTELDGSDAERKRSDHASRRGVRQGLTELDHDLFELTQNNDLTTLPDGVFAGLTELTNAVAVRQLLEDLTTLPASGCSRS